MPASTKIMVLVWQASGVVQAIVDTQNDGDAAYANCPIAPGEQAIFVNKSSIPQPSSQFKGVPSLSVLIPVIKAVTGLTVTAPKQQLIVDQTNTVIDVQVTDPIRFPAPAGSTYLQSSVGGIGWTIVGGVPTPPASAIPPAVIA